MNDADFERLLADLPWATPGSGLDSRVQATLRTATARGRVRSAVMVGSLIAASLALAWMTTARNQGVVVRPHAPLAGDGSADGGPGADGGGAVPRGGPVPHHVAPRSFAGGGSFGMPGPGGAVAMLAAIPAGQLSADATAAIERISPLLQPVSGTVGLVFAAISGVTPLREADRSDPRAGQSILERFDRRGMPWPGQVGRAG
jgi:hypothetical protein